MAHFDFEELKDGDENKEQRPTGVEPVGARVYLTANETVCVDIGKECSYLEMTIEQAKQMTVALVAIINSIDKEDA